MTIHNVFSINSMAQDTNMDGISDSMFSVLIQWLKIPMDGLSESMFLVSIQ